MDFPSYIILTDEDGQEVRFEYLDQIPYNGEDYVLFLDADAEDDNTVYIMQVKHIENSDEDYYLPVEDEDDMNAIYELFKEKHQDDMTFED